MLKKIGNYYLGIIKKFGVVIPSVIVGVLILCGILVDAFNGLSALSNGGFIAILVIAGVLFVAGVVYSVLKLKSKAPGKVDITITNSKEPEGYNMRVFYVHRFGIITYNDVLGDCTGCKTIPISLAIILSYIVYLLIIEFRKSIKQNEFA